MSIPSIYSVTKTAIVDHSWTENMIRKTIKKFPKTDVRYWREKVAFQTPASRTLSVQIQHAGKRAWIGLGTANRDQAAFEARKLYEELRANGWQATFARRRGADPQKKVNVTVGEFLAAVRQESMLYPKTIESYAQALRKIAGDIAGKQDGRDAIRLRVLTAEKVESWRDAFIRRIGVNPVKEKSARVSANSFISRARALFGKEVVSRVRDLVELPEPLPFAGVKIERVRATRYRSTFDIATLVDQARAELPQEQLKIFLLAAFAGLRRNEVDKLPWSAFRWNEGVIRIETTEFFRPKSHDSEADVLVDAELLEVFRGFYARRKSEFVIESDGQPKHAATFDRYRCQDDFLALIGWLRSHGVVSRTPLHSLRKEYGSQVNARYGLTAAQEMLRHSDISTTASHYIEGKKRSVLGFSHLLKNERTIIQMDKTPRSVAEA
jgi:integrase-like protein